MQIPILVTDKLKEVLSKHDIDYKDYKPAYGGESIGLDLYYTGDKSKFIQGSTMSDYDGKPVGEPEKVLLQTGLHIALPKGYVAFIKDRGSISKTNMVRRAGVIDPGYTGEIFVNLMGADLVEPGEKLPVQLVVIKAETDYNVVTEKEFTELTSNATRKEGKTGSSD